MNFRIITFIFAMMLSLHTTIAQKSIPAITIEKEGNGSPIIFLPGFGCPGEVWKEITPAFTSNHTCISVTYAGFGETAAIQSPWLKQIENELTELIEKMPKATLVGHSMGGLIAMNLAAKYPDKIGRVIVIDMLPCMGAVMMPNYSPDSISFDSPYNKQLISMNDESFKSLQENISKRMTRKEDKQRLIAEWMIKCNRKTYVNGYTELLKCDMRPTLSNIKQPVLLLAAGNVPYKEQVLPNYEKQYVNLQNKRLEMIDTSAHFMMFDEPDILTDKIKEFIQ